MEVKRRMKTAKVTVVPYDSRWAEEFEAIKQELSQALGELALAIEHVGSTSVKGMSAKPCIDIDVVIEDYSVFDETVSRLAAIGYIHEGDLGIADRHAFRYDSKPHLQKHHLYVCPKASEELRRHIVFRDYLRANEQAVAEYSAVKEEGARLYPDDIDGYIAHKSPCIARLYKLCSLE
jgi:GrpB-like predicted nucleotidyltransferase (UPF0157 family)